MVLLLRNGIISVSLRDLLRLARFQNVVGRRRVRFGHTELALTLKALLDVDAMGILVSELAQDRVLLMFVNLVVVFKLIHSLQESVGFSQKVISVSFEDVLDRLRVATHVS